MSKDGEMTRSEGGGETANLRTGAQLETQGLYTCSTIGHAGGLSGTRA